MDRALTVVAFGLPLAMASSAAGFFLGLPAGKALSWTPAAFLIGLALACVLGFSLRRPAAVGALRLAAAAVLASLPLQRSAGAGRPPASSGAWACS